MDVTIIIVNYNTAELVSECVDSVYKSKPKAKFEVIIVDNGSDDALSLKKIKKSYPGIKILFNKKNEGYSKANNQGIKMALGNYVWLLNSDTVVKKNALDALLSAAKQKIDGGVFGSKLYNANGSVQESCLRFPTHWRALKQYFLGRKGLLDKYAPNCKKTCEVEALVGASFFVTPVALDKVGILNEKYFMFYEDIDYCRRVRDAGLKVYYVALSRVIHYHGKSGERLVNPENQWRRLIPSAKIYHGRLGFYLFNLIIWAGQKWQKLKNSL